MDKLQAVPVTMALGKAGFAAGTTTTITIGNTTAFTIRSKAYSKSSASNAASPTTDINTGVAFLGVVANKGSVFVVGVNASGTLQAAQGSIEDLDTSGNFIEAPQFPSLPDAFCPLGYLVIKAGSTANATTGWVFGSSNMSSVTGITYTFVDIVALPDRPQVS